MVGVGFGVVTTSITDVMMWLVGALYSGFVAANVLKWYWWRFNGYGYFWGMVAGIGGAMVLPPVAEQVVGHSFNALYTFPVLLLISLVGCLAGTYLSETRGRRGPQEVLQDRESLGMVGPHPRQGDEGGPLVRAQPRRRPRPGERRRRHRLAAVPRDAFRSTSS